MVEADRKIFFADTSFEAHDHAKVFWDLAKASGLVPIFYEGLKETHADQGGERIIGEMLEDLYSAEAIFVYLGKPTYSDNAALKDIARAVTGGAKAFIYVGPDFSPRTISQLGISVLPIVVKDAQAFQQRLRADMQSLRA